MSVPYICYAELKEFHTLKEVCELFRMEKQELKKKCETYGIHPRRNEIGEWGLVKYDVRKLHRMIQCGELRAVKVGREYRITLAALAEFLEE